MLQRLERLAIVQRLESLLHHPRTVVVKCPNCGRDIVVERHSAAGIISEYVGKNGFCFDCVFK